MEKLYNNKKYSDYKITISDSENEKDIYVIKSICVNYTQKLVIL